MYVGAAPSPGLGKGEEWVFFFFWAVLDDVGWVVDGVCLVAGEDSVAGREAEIEIARLGEV
jgi:hypothetical protein